jgi:hypothetical protein
MANMFLNPDLEMTLKFLIAVIDNEVNTGTADEMVTIDAFNEKLEANGHWIMGAGLEKAKVIVTADGEYMSGFWIIEAESREQAEHLAAEGSKACNRKVELRPFLGN